MPSPADLLSDLRGPPAASPPFESTILHRRRYLSMETQRLFARLYLEGLSSGTSSRPSRELMGEQATLSASTIIRLKADWHAEYERFRSRPLTARYTYLWADTISTHLDKGSPATARGLRRPLPGCLDSRVSPS